MRSCIHVACGTTWFCWWNKLYKLIIDNRLKLTFCVGGGAVVLFGTYRGMFVGVVGVLWPEFPAVGITEALMMVGRRRGFGEVGPREEFGPLFVILVLVVDEPDVVVIGLFCISSQRQHHQGQRLVDIFLMFYFKREKISPSSFLPKPSDLKIVNNEFGKGFKLIKIGQKPF